MYICEKFYTWEDCARRPDIVTELRLLDFFDLAESKVTVFRLPNLTSHGISFNP